MKSAIVVLFLALAALLLACSLWFRAESVDAGITDQLVDSLGAVPSTPDSLEGDSIEEAEEPPLLMNYPPEPENIEAPETEEAPTG